MNETVELPQKRNKWSVAFGVFSAFVMLAVLLLVAAGPIVAKLANKELRAMGFAPAGLETLSLDWLAREIRLGPVSLEKPDQDPLRIASLTLHYDLAALWERRLWVRSLDIGGIDVTVVRDASGVLWLNDVAVPTGGETDSQAESAAQPWLPGLERMVLSNSHIRFQDDAGGVNASVRLDRVVLDNFFGWTPDQPGHFDVSAQINDMDLHTNGTAKPFSSTLNVTSQGQLAAITTERISSLVKLPDFGPINAGGTLDWDLQMMVDAPEDAPLKLHVETDLRVGGLSANVSDGDVLAKINTISFDGLTLDLDVPQEAPLTLNATTGLQVVGIEANAYNGAASANVGKISLDAIALGLGETGVPVISVERIGGEAVHLNLSEKVATLSSSQQDGQASDPTPSTDPEQATTAPNPFSLRVGHVELDDNSHIVFSDDTFDPPFTVQFEFDALTVDNVTSDQPEQPIELSLRGKVNEFAPVSLSGWAKPLAENPSFDLTASVETLDLPAFSPFVAKTVGMHLDGGRLGVSGTGKAVDGQLDAKLDIGLDKLDFTPLSEEDREKLSASVGMPVETVVGLLEDGDGHISIALPIKGDMENPKFDLSDAIGQAVGGAIKSAAGGVFKVLFPPAALISLIAEHADGSVSFKPFTFPAGQAELSGDAQTHANQLALVLKERPKLGIQLCGRTTKADLDALSTKAYDDALLQKSQLASQDGSEQAPQNDQASNDEPQLTAEERASLDKQVRAQLSEMAVTRTRKTKRYLIETHAIKAARLAECRPTFDEKDTNGPRVDVIF